MSTIGTNIVIEAASRLGTLIDAHAREAGRQLGERLRPWLRDGETLPDFTLVLRLPARMIRQGGRRLRERRNELDEARRDEREARFRRGQTASALRRKLVEIRRLLTSALGPKRTSKLLGIQRPTAHDSQTALLLSQADAFLTLLRDPRRLAIPRADCYFDPAAIVAALELLAAALSQARDRLDEIRRASAARLEARDRTRTELCRGVRNVVSILGGWLLLIRRTDLAEKLQLIDHPGRAGRTRPGKEPRSGKAGKTTNRSKRKEEPM